MKSPSPSTRFASLSASLWGRLLWLVLGAVLTLYSTGMVWSALQPHFEVHEVRENGAEFARPLPWTFQGARKNQHLRVRYSVGWLSSRQLHIVPDDEFVSLRVNGEEVPLTGVSEKARRDYHAGFSIDLQEHLRRGDNTIDLFVTNHHGAGGLNVNALPGLKMAGVWLACLPWLFGLCWLFRLRKGPTAVLALGLLLACGYWAKTPFDVRSYDVFYGGGHMGYIEYIATHWAPPIPNQGWTYYHPPLYYTLGALVRTVAARHEWPIDPMLQALSLWLWQVLMVSGSAALVRSFSAARVPPRRALLAVALLVLWPSNFLHAIRVGNDAGLYACAGLTTFFLVTWWQSGEHRRLLAAALCTALALACKSNASVLAATLLALLGLWFWRHWRERRWPSAATWASSLAAVALLGLGVAATFGNAYYHYRLGHSHDWLIGNVNGLDDGLRVPVDVESFIPLDLPTFLTEPWMNTRGEGTGRTNFWNFMLRSSITGEFRFPGLALRGLALALGVVLLLLLLPLAAWPFRARSLRAGWRRLVRNVGRYTPWYVLGAAWFFSLMALRIKAPYSCSNDFRYISPVLIPLAFALAHRGRFSALCQLAMVVLSAVFFAVFAAT